MGGVFAKGAEPATAAPGKTSPGALPRPPICYLVGGFRARVLRADRARHAPVERLALVLGGTGAATAVSAAALCAVPGRLLPGGLLGRADRRLAAAGNFAMQASGVALLALTSGTPALLIGCALFGLGIGNLVLLPPIIVQAEFEPADTPRVVALVTAVNQAVFAFAPLAFGLCHDLTGGYTVPFTAAAVFELAAGMIVLTGREMLNGGARVICEPGAR